jgi:serine/threonine-protein kinase
MVMEFLEGSDLSTLLKTKGAVPVDTAVEYVLQACEAIAEAHSLGIIHRDLKPANLFVARRADGSPVVKVIDFGISKMADPNAESDVEMTKTDVMMGSPVYMAPEQMFSARDVDVRADVWSLGIILYYLVMGSQPFKGTSVTQLYASILEGPPRMCDTRPDVPAGLEAAVMKSLMAVPKERWSNVAEFALAIADFGPPHTRVSADRVARTLGVSPIHASAPPPPGTTSATPSGVASTAGSGGTDASTGPHTDGSWGGTQGPVQRRRSRGALLAIGVVAALALGAAGVTMLLRHGGIVASSGAAPDTTSTAITTVVAPAGTGATVTPATAVTPVVVSPPATATATASSSTSAAPSVSVAAKPPTSPGSKLPGARPPPKPKTDLFSDPH